jgi:transposase
VILVPRSVRVYFATQPTNLRMSFEGLSNAVREVLRQDPLGGHIFVFLNRRKNMVKLLVYTRGGYTIVMKRLDAGKFELPRATSPGQQHLVVSDAIFEVIHKGVALTPRAARRRLH